MFVSIILPTANLKLYQSKASLVYSTLLKSKTYYEFYKSGAGGEVYLEYSPDLPRTFCMPEFLYWVNNFKPKYVVLPSEDFSAEGTIALASNVLRNVRNRIPVGVVQGHDLESLDRCYRYLRDNCGIIALPSSLEMVANRNEIIRDLGIKEDIVFIEVYKNPETEVPPKTALGIFTSFPVRLAQDFRRLSEFELGRRVPPMLDFKNRSIPVDLIKSNIEEYLFIVRSVLE